MTTTEPHDDKTRPSDRTPPLDPDPGRSAERERQDEAIASSSRESWITQLLRSLHLSKGRPKPGHDKAGRSP
jgi:hypothetical protein